MSVEPKTHKVVTHEKSEIVLPENGEPRTVGRVVLHHLDDQLTRKDYTGNYKIKAILGAYCFERAVERMFGTKMKGVPQPPSFFSAGKAPEVKNVTTQEHIYKTPMGLYIEDEIVKMELNHLVQLAVEIGINVPSPYSESHRSQLIYGDTEMRDNLLRSLFSLYDEANDQIDALRQQGVDNVDLRTTDRLRAQISRLEEELAKTNGILDAAEIVDTVSGQLQVPFGTVEVLKSNGEHFGYASLEENEDKQFFLAINTTVSNEHAVKQLREIMLREFELCRIIKETAWDYNEDCHFKLAPKVVDDLILSNEQHEMIQGQILGRVKFSDKIRRCAPQLAKGSILLPGEFGTGKTMSLMVSAWFAIQHRWTVVRWMPSRADVKNEFHEVLEFVRTLGRAMIIIEDVDKLINNVTEDEFSNILDDLDGSATKHAPLITLMTTNHPEDIQQAVVRRFQGMISFDKMDESGIERLVKKSMGRNWIGWRGDDKSTIYDIPTVDVDFNAEADDLSEVIALYKEYEFTPWLIRLVSDRALLFALPQRGDAMYISSADLLRSAKSLIPQFQLYTRAEMRPKKVTTIDSLVFSATEKALTETLERINNK